MKAVILIVPYCSRIQLTLATILRSYLFSLMIMNATDWFPKGSKVIYSTSISMPCYNENSLLVCWYHAVYLWGH